MPKEWREGLVQDFLFLQRGFDLTAKEAKKGNIPVYSSSGVAYFHNEAKVNGPGIVTGRKGSVGPVYLINEDFWPHDTTLWVKDFRGNDINYIHYFLIFLQLEKFDEASSVPTLNRNNVHGVKCIFPPVCEQKKIAQILSTWDKTISVTEKLLTNSQQQKKALMQQLLTGKKRLLDENGVRFSGEWKHKKLAEICSIKTGKKDVNEGNPEGKYPFFTCASEPTRSDSYSYDCEALLIAGNGVLGKTHYYKGKFEAYQRTYILSEFDGVSILFIYQYILHWLSLDISRGKQHGAMPYIKLGLLQNFKVFTPCNEEQQKIAAVLSAADAEISTLEKKLACLKDEKKALMQQLLTGKRRVKVEAEEAVSA
ncbi:restriction endonuclease subunit S [Citrobacter europaeus]|uniref:restriction endonuclease subunit S n=1 Tax=Citrobacter europaeus TaxID=1914243 RepID=UPI003D361802